MIELIYPVGTIYYQDLNTAPNTPANLFGGTWVQQSSTNGIIAWKRTA